MKILAIGNSFSDNATRKLHEVLTALGEKDVYIGNLYIGGCSIDTHVKNAEESLPLYDYRVNDGNGWVTTPNYKSIDALTSEKWDFISMQQASHDSGIAETYARLPELIDFVRKNEKGKAKLFWHMTWAYQGNATHPCFPRYRCSQAKMYEGIINAVKTKVLPEKEISFVVPAGTAVQNARTSYIGDNLTADGFHLSEYGEYIAALSWAIALTGNGVKGITYVPDGVDEKMKAVAIESAENAAKRPFVVSRSEIL